MTNNLFIQRHSSRGAVKQSAIGALKCMLLETGRSEVWRFYNGGNGEYFLKIKIAVMEATDGRGQKTDREIPLPVKE
jgi:hypothetical protein